MTTDPNRSRLGQWRSRLAKFSVRQRLISAVAILVSAALFSAGTALYILESRQLERSIDAGIAQEFDEFRQLAESAESIDDTIIYFQNNNLPDANEGIWGFLTTGESIYLGEPDPAIEESSALPRLVTELSPTGGIEVLEVDGNEYRVGVLPIIQGDERGALVVTHDLTAARLSLREVITTYALLGGLSVVLIIGLSSWLAGRLLQPVRSLRETAQVISAGSLGERIDVTGNDDLTEMQVTFNDMLDRLETAFATQRQMLDDAGHELRTPLTILRGHLEVLDVRNPADVESTRTLLLDEIDRMSRLVGDLLMLAKSRRPDFVQLEETSLEDLVQGVVERSQALADRDWRAIIHANGTAPLDAQRITQALLQLADNAVRFTQEGGRIVIGVARAGEILEFWVGDDGPGVPPDQHHVVFERFAQAESSGDGFGLGLSIVSAIAEAHGGYATLDPHQPGQGATFRLIFGRKESQ